ncbi:Glucan 1,3-beta-glucosidase Exg2 [Schizosaccharomyces pombe]|uniref:Glucan endo-1,6-beta-glucosidase exg2 n=1 Tax=Schizosaccharomyces pombe (strain 972 / ATCC 24843) TaxID=284812 RepID=EXG2_SCHPO|nr:glucan glucosidase exg2 [Schizosaccharomyces pombe]Q10444.1 RecName: Full=Glucan 1,3-beta-glucosidase 2; AltName: Full=Exo-1,3-beta-glucanase 2; Flags: Precursor [Schizosaccharomyces pombe 972h-]CAA94701.1 glucan glucosidase Exg2, unknown specificity [Schizosaccharomyces pombe]|eukprot:NP_594643.1 glucan glucosidase exg2 [Schizosaccharomyces pombe]
MSNLLEAESSCDSKSLGVDDFTSKRCREIDKKALLITILLTFFVSLCVFLSIILPLIFLVIIPHAQSDRKIKDTNMETTNLGVNIIDEIFNSTQVPEWAKNSLLDTNTWLDTSDFNTSFTNETFAGLYTMGIFDKYDDSVQANPNVPPLNEPFPYGRLPIRGVNLGGWLSMEPFITPSFFQVKNETAYLVKDELSLHAYLGENATSVIENHYNTFVTKQTFYEIREAGLDHVRITFPYWILYSNEITNVSGIGWRYLLRSIEWAREQGLRVNLDLHAAPGNQNSWNHGGYLNQMEWLDGTVKGEENSQFTLKIHERLASFFSQKRYRNVVTIYGALNEPNFFVLDEHKITDWHKQAYAVIRQSNFTGLISLSDGFRGPGNWEDHFDPFHFPNILIDVHRYIIFNDFLIGLRPKDKLNVICKSWNEEMKLKAKLPTIIGEWSLADTDCAKFLNNVGEGARWDGTFTPNGGVASCSEKVGCRCDFANQDPENYEDSYRKFLYALATSQIETFDKTWGWFYWNWDTENATQWSYKKSWLAGLLPRLAYSTTKDFNCSMLDSKSFMEFDEQSEF